MCACMTLSHMRGMSQPLPITWEEWHNDSLKPAWKFEALQQWNHNEHNRRLQISFPLVHPDEVRRLGIHFAHRRMTHLAHRRLGLPFQRNCLQLRQKAKQCCQSECCGKWIHPRPWKLVLLWLCVLICLVVIVGTAPCDSPSETKGVTPSTRCHVSLSLRDKLSCAQSCKIPETSLEIHWLCCTACTPACESHRQNDCDQHTMHLSFWFEQQRRPLGWQRLWQFRFPVSCKWSKNFLGIWPFDGIVLWHPASSETVVISVAFAAHRLWACVQCPWPQCEQSYNSGQVGPEERICDNSGCHRDRWSCRRSPTSSVVCIGETMREREKRESEWETWRKEGSTEKSKFSHKTHLWKDIKLVWLRHLSWTNLSHRWMTKQCPEVAKKRLLLVRWQHGIGEHCMQFFRKRHRHATRRTTTLFDIGSVFMGVTTDGLLLCHLLVFFFVGSKHGLFLVVLTIVFEAQLFCNCHWPRRKHWCCPHHFLGGPHQHWLQQSKQQSHQVTQISLQQHLQWKWSCKWRAERLTRNKDFAFLQCVNCIICGGACNQPPSPHCIVNNKDKWVGIIYHLSIFVLHVEDVKWCHLVLHCIIGPALSLKDDVPSMEMLSSMTVGVLFKCVIRFVSVAYKIWHEESIHQINFVLPQVIEKNICRVCIYSNRKHWMCRELLLQTQVQECLHKNK